MIFRSMEAATQEGREFFDLREAELDPFLFPNLVRYYAKGLLDARGLHAVDDPDALSRADIANNGLLFTYRAYLV
ncbi:MAG TPA: hypothetical protein VFO24_11200, partial [Usitatibacter sp.]|nr:hypothetical protein [Usitatibacter sp.]